MYAVDTQIDNRALSSLYDFIVQLFLYLGNNLLNACRMDTAVGYKLVKGQTAYFTANWVKC